LFLLRLKRTTFLVGAALLFSFAPLSAQETPIGKLLGLNVTGNKTSEPGVIKLSSGLSEGSDITSEEVQRAVKQLWALGIFSDVRIVQDLKTPDGLFLTLQVVEYPRLERLEITGNRKLKKEDIEKELSLFRGQVVNPSQTAKAQKQLTKMYSEKGYTLARIQVSEEPTDKEGRVVLKLHVDEGRKVQIKRIRFLGNSAFTNKKLRKQMKDTKENGLLKGGDFDREKFETDKDKVLEFYRNQGYRDAEILGDTLYYDAEKKDLFIDVTVTEGGRYYVGRVTFEGNALFTEPQLRDMLEFSEGDPFSQEKFDKTLGEKIGGAYSDLGYISAQINPVETLRGGDTLDIAFSLQEGQPYSIRKILITGNTRTKERVIRREIRIQPGDVFSKELLVRSARELMMLNYFSNVVPDGTPVGESQMDLSFKVEEKSTDTANLSAGYSELYKLIGSVGLGMNNLFGNGQRLSLDWNFGKSYRSFNLGFTEPWFMNTPTLIGFDLFDTKSEAYYIPYSQSSRGLSLRFGRRLSWPDNYFRGDWIYRIDEISLGDFEDYIVESNPNGIVTEHYPLISSGITQVISRNSLDQPEFPTRGSQVSLTTEIAGGPFGGNVGYMKEIFSAEYFMPTFIPKLVLLGRAMAGHMYRLSKGGRIPYTDYFYMGGSGLSRSTPLRGYEDPLSSSSYYSYGYYTETEGGKAMFKTTAELRFPIIPNPTMYGLIFAEAGNTWRDLAHADPFNLRRSVGVGARIYMPMVGMIGFDYAYGFDNLDANGEKTGKWKPHFVFGKSF
jgi:outer membrane protein insertion porin family